MKKLSTLLLLATLLLTSCVNPNPLLDGTGATTAGKNELTTPPDIEETTTPEEESSTSSDNPPPYVEPLFINYYEITLNDLYTLLGERSNDPSDYEKIGISGGVPSGLLSTIPDANVLITLEDMNLQSTTLMDDFKEVRVSCKNDYYSNEDLYEYSYFFKRAYIYVLYAPERVSKDGWEGDSRPRMEGGLSAFLANNPSKEYVYTEKIGDYTVDYTRSVDYFEGTSYSYKNILRICTDDFCIWFYHVISTVHDNPPCEEIEKFFSEETYQDAILQLIEGIENRE